MKIALERGHFELLKLLAQLGFLINFPPVSSKDSDQQQAIQRFCSEVSATADLKDS